MVYELNTNDTSQITLVGELLEYSRCRATHGILEINGICQVDGKSEPIDYDEEPLTELVISLVFLLVKRKQHQYHIKHIGIEDGRRVEKQSSTKDIQRIG
jgi:hypothetical protein